MVCCAGPIEASSQCCLKLRATFRAADEKTFARRQKANIIAQRAASSLRADMNENGKNGEEGPGTGVVVKAKPKTKKPSMYKVLMLNDDYTPMEFVVHILERFFNKNRQEATRIMLHVHRRGVGVCGVYTYEVAETKVTQVMDFARQHQHPLQCTLEKD
jgi:ATP-dependent Clp protease adaptor protein ClpS